MSGGRFAGHDPQQGHDTARVPWAGRTLSGTGFDDDSGTADPALLRALADPSDEIALVASVRRARLLVPVVTVPGHTVASGPPTGAPPPAVAPAVAVRTEGAAGLLGDATSDMAAVILVAPDGVRALPAFSSLAALSAWDPTARPVPVTAQRAALAAVQEGCGALVLDLAPTADPDRGSHRSSDRVADRAPRSEADRAPHSEERSDRAAGGYALRSSMVWALAMDRPWLPAHLEARVDVAVAAAVAAEPAATAYALAAGWNGALQITLSLLPGLRRAEVQALVTRVGERLAADEEVRARIDAVAFTLREDD